MFSSLTVSTHKDFTDNLLFDIVLMLLNKTVLDVEGFLIVVIFSFLDTKTNALIDVVTTSNPTVSSKFL